MHALKMLEGEILVPCHKTVDVIKGDWASMIVLLIQSVQTNTALSRW